MDYYVLQGLFNYFEYIAQIWGHFKDYYNFEDLLDLLDFEDFDQVVGLWLSITVRGLWTNGSIPTSLTLRTDFE